MMLLPLLIALAGPQTVQGATVAPATPAAAVARAADEFPDSWFWRMGSAGVAHKAMTGKAPPALDLTQWKGDAPAIEALVGKDGKDGKGDIWSNLRGRVVVVDFWGTWCGPCMKAIPENVELMRDHAADGLVIIGVHDSTRGTETIDEVIAAKRINYPVAVDDGGKSARAWKVGFWPTYAVIDRKGVVRAIGLKPPNVRAVVEKLLKETLDGAPAGDRPEGKPGDKPGAKAPSPSKPGGAANGTGTIAPAGDALPRKWPIARELLEGDGRRRGAVARFDQCPEAPSLGGISQWRASGEAIGKAKSLADLKGKIVVIDFWATWCVPCIASIPKNNELARRYADKGVVFIGVCHPEGGEKMLDVVHDKGIAYTVCLDTRGEAIANYVVDTYPDYYLIDRDGRLRGADVDNGSLETAIKVLLAEDQPKP